MINLCRQVRRKPNATGDEWRLSAIGAAVGINAAHALLVNQTRVVSTEVTRGVQAAVQDVKPWVERAARVGHAAKGVVYLLVGFFALAADLGMRHERDGPESAFITLRHAPLCRAIVDPEHEAARRILPRLEWLVTAVIFGSLAFAAFQLAFGHTGTGDDESARNWVERVMSGVPYGAWVLGVSGVVIAVAGLVFIKRGWTADPERQIDMTDLPPRSWHAIYAAARLGMMARGVVIAVIGVFVLIAAWTHDPGEAVGFAGALRIIGHQTYGPWLRAGVALGLVGYGVYELLVSWRGRFHVR